jgi:hypothetical protein
MHGLFYLFELLFVVFLILVMLSLIGEKVYLNFVLFLILNFDFLYLFVKTKYKNFFYFYIVLCTIFVSVFDVGSELHEHNFEPIIFYI